MANVRLLRQSLEDYNERIAKIDAQYRADYGKYTSDVEAYNADVLAHPYTEQTLQHGPGYIMGKTPVTQVQSVDDAGQPVTDMYGNPMMVTVGGVDIVADKPTDKPVPVAPAESVAPRAPSITNSDYRALAAPGTDQAGVARANALGYTGKSELVGDQSGAMRNSAFADPADPQGLKERGILARVMGGQL